MKVPNNLLTLDQFYEGLEKHRDEFVTETDGRVWDSFYNKGRCWKCHTNIRTREEFNGHNCPSRR